MSLRQGLRQPQQWVPPVPADAVANYCPPCFDPPTVPTVPPLRHLHLLAAARLQGSAAPHAARKRARSGAGVALTRTQPLAWPGRVLYALRLLWRGRLCRGAFAAPQRFKSAMPDAAPATETSDLPPGFRSSGHIEMKTVRHVSCVVGRAGEKRWRGAAP